MKKKNFLYTGTLALGMFMSGCSDSFLDMNNYGAYDDFNSETKITWYLAGLYQTSFEFQLAKAGLMLMVGPNVLSGINNLTKYQH